MFYAHNRDRLIYGVAFYTMLIAIVNGYLWIISINGVYPCK
jgi:hypothetical protein